MGCTSTIMRRKPRIGQTPPTRFTRPPLTVFLLMLFIYVGWLQRPEGIAATAVMPGATPSEFAKSATKLREHEIDQIPPLNEPTTLHPVIQRYPWKMNIVTTVFWLGQKNGGRIRSLPQEFLGPQLGEKLRRRTIILILQRVGTTSRSGLLRDRIRSTVRCRITT